MPVRITLVTSIPVGAPRNSRIGTANAGFSVSVISYIRPVTASASGTDPPTKRTIAGAVAITMPPMPMVSAMAESPMSGLASSGPNPARNSPFGYSAGPVNHSSPVPDTRIPKSVPLRHIAVTTVLPGMPAAASPISFPAGITRFRKKWSLPATNLATSAMSLGGSPEAISAGRISRRNIRVPARLRLWPSSPICTIWPMIAVMSTGPAARTAIARAGPRTSAIQRSRVMTSAEYAP